MLEWKSGNLKAVGRKGVYTIERAGGSEDDRFRLTGVGHDSLPLLDLQAFGETYPSIDDAKHRAETVDRSKTGEAVVSGC